MNTPTDSLRRFLFEHLPLCGEIVRLNHI